ncbi:MAG: alanyl-tRNA editing protein, partial [Burkholderiaceae bacterium]
MTDALFRADAYLTECSASVVAVGPQGIVLDRTVFYPLGGGQAGDAGVLIVTSGAGAGRTITIVDTRKHKDAEGRQTNAICHLPDAQPEGAAGTLAVGDTVMARVDWQRRHRMMRFHTTTHLLCHLVPQLVNGCSITPDHARLDFNMTDPLDKEALTAGIATLVA